MIKSAKTSASVPSLPSYRLKPWQLFGAYLLAVIVLMTRRPDALLHAQFYAEDGHVWFADAYNNGWWHALFHTWTGYFLTLPRLGAAVALLVPFRDAPLTLNALAIAIMALPVVLLLSERSGAWGDIKTRGLLAAFYLALPNCAEIHASITESQWILALCAFLILTGTPPLHRRLWIGDAAILLLCGLTGPFFLFLIPIAVYLLRQRRSSWRWTMLAALVIPAIAQIVGMLLVRPAPDPLNHRAGGLHSLGATPSLLARITGGHIYMGSLLGGNHLALIPGSAATWLLACAAVAGSAFVIASWLRGTLPMKLLIVLAAGLFAASLASSTVGLATSVSAWQTLAGGEGIRYWFFPTLAVVWSIAYGLRSPFKQLKAASYALLCILCFGIYRDWRHPAFQDQNFSAYAQQWQGASAGMSVRIPLNPAGWELQLVKR